MEWNTLCGHTEYAADRSSLVTVYHLNTRDVVLIDSGSDPNSGFPDELDALGLRVRAVLCTHLHIDHIAHNRALAQRHHAEIFASEEAIQGVKDPRLLQEEFGLTCSALAQKLSDEYKVSMTPIGRQRFLTIDGADFEILPTPGHSQGHLAFVTPDGVCCLGDALLSPKLLNSSKLPFMVDVNAAVDSMIRLRDTAYPCYVVAHKTALTRSQLSEVADLNIDKERFLYDRLKELAANPVDQEALVTLFLRFLGIRPLANDIRRDILRQTARARVVGLLHTGELMIENGAVFCC